MAYMSPAGYTPRGCRLQHEITSHALWLNMEAALAKAGYRCRADVPQSIRRYIDAKANAIAASYPPCAIVLRNGFAFRPYDLRPLERA